MVASDEILKRTSDQYRRIRNTFRFILGNLSDFSKDDTIEMNELIELDKWIVESVFNLEKKVLEHYNSYTYHRAVQAIHNFCVNELGGIYLDITKDRLYTCKSNSHARRSAQTSLDIVLNVLVRLVAPILSYTAEEIWQSSNNLLDQEKSVFLSSFSSRTEQIQANISKQDWKRIFEIKEEVNQTIEELRNDNKLKGSLDAAVTLSLSSEDKKIIDKLGNELHFLFITSKANTVLGDDLKVKISVSQDEKCTRCWHRDESVGSVEKHSEICSRCISNIDEEGEKREFV